MKTFETSINEIESIYAYFHDPARSAAIQMAIEKTKYYLAAHVELLPSVGREGFQRRVES